MEICLLKLSIIRVFFSISIETIIFFNITSNLVLIFEKTYNLAIAISNSSLFFLYICIIVLEFDFTIFINFDFSILNMSTTNNKLRSFFYNASILNRLNFDNFLIEYFSKNFAILFD